eukprot:TRINITY_DN1264_c2_g1_i3.p1 TRINITY_DN1264_c2_g1~~TRINITY_DN1264_c2_g1_i3.p1  ORF type:complete len:379 (-),score=133.74 TRINITY_DN1264_c2_g1_i3:105-1241(-)
MSDINPEKLNVAQLKEELSKRNFPVSGKKADLIERLKEALSGKEPPKKGSKKRKKQEEDEEDDGDDDSGGEAETPKKKAKLDTDFSSPALNEGELKIVTWNVASLNAVMKKGFEDYLASENPDILCLNETKIDSSKVPEGKFKGYHTYIYSADKPGYSGVGLITKVKPISLKKGIGVAEHDTEGRCITAEYSDFYLVATYIPNSGRPEKGSGDKLPGNLDKRMKWDVEFQKYLNELNKKKPIIWCGDLNVAHKEIDLTNPSKNKYTAGFTDQERKSFDKFLSEGYVDSFRHLHPDEKGAYSFWAYRGGAREKNIGWRLDYFVVSKSIISRVTQSYIRKHVLGSDHCPIAIHFKKGESKQEEKKEDTTTTTTTTIDNNN